MSEKKKRVRFEMSGRDFLNLLRVSKTKPYVIGQIGSDTYAAIPSETVPAMLHGKIRKQKATQGALSGAAIGALVAPVLMKKIKGKAKIPAALASIALPAAVLGGTRYIGTQMKPIVEAPAGRLLAQTLIDEASTKGMTAGAVGGTLAGAALARLLKKNMAAGALVGGGLGTLAGRHIGALAEYVKLKKMLQNGRKKEKTAEKKRERRVIVSRQDYLRAMEAYDKYKRNLAAAYATTLLGSSAGTLAAHLGKTTKGKILLGLLGAGAGVLPGIAYGVIAKKKYRENAPKVRLIEQIGLYDTQTGRFEPQIQRGMSTTKFKYIKDFPHMSEAIASLKK